MPRLPVEMTWWCSSGDFLVGTDMGRDLARGELLYWILVVGESQTSSSSMTDDPGDEVKSISIRSSIGSITDPLPVRLCEEDRVRTEADLMLLFARLASRLC